MIAALVIIVGVVFFLRARNAPVDEFGTLSIQKTTNTGGPSKVTTGKRDSKLPVVLYKDQEFAKPHTSSTPESPPPSGKRFFNADGKLIRSTP